MIIDTEARNEPESTLQTMNLRGRWTRNFLPPENDRFFNLTFDYVAEYFGPPDDDLIVDAGCGPGVKSLQLARRGFFVFSLDFSEAIL